MANSILKAVYVTGKTLYAILVRSSDGLVWNGTGWEAFLTAHWATYAIAAAEVSTTGIYYGTMPAVGEGLYDVLWYVQAGGSPAPTDAQLTPTAIQWTGTALFDPGSSPVVLPANAPAGFLASILIDGVALPSALQIIAATTAGKITTAGMAQEIFLGLDGVTARVAVTTDAAGNRTAIVYS